MGREQQIGKIIVSDKDNDRDFINIIKSLTVNGITPRKKLCSVEEAEVGADRLVRELDAECSRKFFLKCMYHLPYEEREAILFCAKRPTVRKPANYFVFSAKRALKKYGY